MSRIRDPLIHGFWCVGYVLNGEDKVATFFQMESAQEALVRMMKMGIECNGMWEKIVTSQEVKTNLQIYLIVVSQIMQLNNFI